jgi:hypothetical protein
MKTRARVGGVLWLIGVWVLATAGIVLPVAMLAGCEPRVTSPISGAELTGPELVLEAQREEKRIAREFEAKAEAADKAMRDARRKALTRANAIAANVDQSKAEADRLLAELKINTEADLSGAEADLERAKASFADAIAGLEADTTEALAVAEKKRQQALGAFKFISDIPVVGQAAASVGIDPAAIGTLLFGGGALAYQARRGSRRRDEAYDDGFKAAKDQADEACKREHDAWEEAQSKLLLLHTPPPTTKP